MRAYATFFFFLTFLFSCTAPHPATGEADTATPKLLPIAAHTAKAPALRPVAEADAMVGDD